MSIENIETDELKQFAETAKNDGWDVKLRSGILIMSGKKCIQ